MRRLAPLLCIPVLALTGCIGINSLVPDDPGSPTGGDGPQITPTQSAAPSDEPSEDPGSTEPGPDDGGEYSHDELNKYDGVATKALGNVPSAIGALRQRQKEANPSELMAQVQYRSEDGEAKALYWAYYPQDDDGRSVPVDSVDSPIVDDIVAATLKGLETEKTRDAARGGYDWQCVEGSQEDGDVAHSICMTAEYGRIVELQYLNVGDVDRDSIDDALATIGEAVADMKS